MGRSFRVFRIVGIEVKVHWTFVLLLALFAFVGYGVVGSVGGALIAVGMIGALFLCVVLHEFEHALTARRLGIGVEDVTLLPVGGLARLEDLHGRPTDEVGV